jgi:hypothetical protein
VYCGVFILGVSDEFVMVFLGLNGRCLGLGCGGDVDPFLVTSFSLCDVVPHRLGPGRRTRYNTSRSERNSKMYKNISGIIYFHPTHPQRPSGSVLLQINYPRRQRNGRITS